MRQNLDLMGANNTKLRFEGKTILHMDDDPGMVALSELLNTLGAKAYFANVGDGKTRPSPFDVVEAIAKGNLDNYVIGNSQPINGASVDLLVLDNMMGGLDLAIPVIEALYQVENGVYRPRQEFDGRLSALLVHSGSPLLELEEKRLPFLPKPAYSSQIQAAISQAIEEYASNQE